MALMKCPDCSREISTSAKECKWCGCSDERALERKKKSEFEELAPYIEKMARLGESLAENKKKEEERKKQMAEEERKKAEELGISVEEYRNKQGNKAAFGCIVVIWSVLLIFYYWETISELPLVKSLID